MDEDELIETPDETESFFEEDLEDISDLVNFGAMDIAESSDASGAYFSATQTTEYESETVTVVIPEAAYDDDVYSEESDEEDTDLETPDDVETYSDDNDYENLNVATVATVGAVSAGERVIVLVKNGVPTVIGAEGWGDGIEADIADAAAVAAEAREVADATNQHFFSDASGVHVTEAEGDATTDHNILINSLGILLRKATNYLVSITSSAIAFYDGLGTAAGNMVASFGATLARIGYAAGKHVDVTEDGLGIYDGDTQVASFGENLVEIGTDPMLSAGMASSVVSMTGGSFQIESSINPLGGGRRTNVEVVGDSGREQYLSFIDGLSYIDLRSLGTSELGAAEFIAGVRSVDEAGVAFVECSTDGTASETKIKGDSIEMVGPVTASSSVSATSFSGAGSSLTGLNGSNISSGTIAAARVGNLPASKITSGTFGASRLPLATLDSQGAMSAEMYRRVYHIDVGSGTTPVLTVRTPNDNGAQWQMGINPTSGAVNVRAYNGSAWSAWKTIATVSWS